ncbi:VCBS repeat-containing protein, partial [Flavihumibacter sp. CACIAM 22H1]|uniref:VCBS repeat-containing protein n=1 Tax=Flavihumibacter sp. CACIAM 22H1 TaxID=1812911 RepID=UPI0007A889CB
MWKSVNIVLALISLLTSCNSKKNPTAFDVVGSEQSGLAFINRLQSTDSLNMFSYMYFYNGAGMGAGDFNNDGSIDLFFAANQERNRLYLNRGSLRFEDVTEAALIPDDKGWSTGVSVIDINNDGLLDLYICRVATLQGLTAGNQLLLCTGIKDGVPQYKEMAASYGLDFKGLSTMAAFLDYDLDGDLDMYLMNHSLHHNGTFGERSSFLGTYHPISGDRFFRNEGSRFVDVTREVGIHSSVIGYGLGISIADINLDGYPDIYIGNDFHENDYLYINQKDGSFLDKSTEQLQHTSQFSMGVDIADINNDALPEIISVDMLPEDPYILKRSLGEDEYNISLLKLRYGYQPQYTRNNLQLNNGNASFSEIGFYAGVFASDWSWAPLWLDFDNDGYKDLFISNGIPKRLNDIDYVNFISNDAMQRKIQSGNIKENDQAVIDQFPQIKLKNKFFRNSGSLTFSDWTDSVVTNPPTFSNGAVYADLDHDGDLDIVVNNINESPLIYRNTHEGKTDKNVYSVRLLGQPANRNALGAKILIFSGQSIFSFEKYPVHGFQSSMEQDLHLALGNANPDSAWIIWPDQCFERFEFPPDSTGLLLKWREGLPKLKPEEFPLMSPIKLIGLDDVTKSSEIFFKHRENPYIEFNRDPLIPHSFTTEGPALAVADINGDKLDDVYVGGARNQPGQLFIQQLSGKFQKMEVPALTRDSVFEDIAAVFADVNKDGLPDLLVASGGNEFSKLSTMNQPRLYLNKGKEGFELVPSAFESIKLTASCIVSADFDGDGFPDFFIGGRTVPADYGRNPNSYLLLNNKKNGFTDVTATWSKDLSTAGFVTGAQWADMNGDGKEDLVVTSEWGTVTVYLHRGDHFEKKQVGKEKGWWTSVFIADINNDGKADILAGNQGLNSRLKASSRRPVRMYYGDFDQNGKTEQLISYYLGEKEVLLASKMEIEKQLPFLKKKFLYAEDFAKASLTDLIGKENLENSIMFTADHFASAAYINKGNEQFELMDLPGQLQYFP